MVSWTLFNLIVALGIVLWDRDLATALYIEVINTEKESSVTFGRGVLVYVVGAALILLL